MKNIKMVILLGATLMTAPLLAACSPVSAVTTTVSAGQVVMDERTPGTMADDARIKAQLLHYFLQTDVHDLLTNVDYTVHEGRVLLTGDVRKEETMINAVKLAWQADGVREVINEIQVTEKADPVRYVKDAAISGQVRTQFVLTKGIKSLNYNIETVDGVVYLIGIAQDETELQLATDIASRVGGVQKVVSFVRLKDSPYRKL